MKQTMKRILSVALVLSLAVNVFCIVPETAQAAAYKKTIKKTVKLKGYQAKELKFKTKANVSLTITAKMKKASDSDQSVSMFSEGLEYSEYISDSKKLTKKVKFGKGTQSFIITSVGTGAVTLTVEIKAKKSALKFMSLKKTKIRTGSSSDDEK